MCNIIYIACVLYFVAAACPARVAKRGIEEGQLMNRQTIFSIFGAALLGLASMACGDGNTDPDDDSVDPIGDRLQPTWARSAGGPSLDQGVDVATDRSGNVFLTGEFRGAATFGAFSETLRRSSGLNRDATEGGAIFCRSLRSSDHRSRMESPGVR